MKRLIAILLVCIMLCGCNRDIPDNLKSAGDAPITPTHKPTEIPPIVTTDTGTRYTIKELPFECPYNDTSFTLKEVQYYTEKPSKNYALYVVLVFDVKDVSEDDMDWFADDLSYPSDSTDRLMMGLKESDITSVWLTNEDNEIKSDRMTGLGKLYYTDTKEYYCIYMADAWDEYRYPFDNCHLDITVSTKQKEKYELNGRKYNKINNVFYKIDITKDDIKPFDDAKKSLKEFITQKIADYANFIKGISG